jgi:hypothetical protein
VPEKSKRSRKNKAAPKEEEVAESHKDKKVKKEVDIKDESDDESEFQGFEFDVDEPGPAVGEVGSEDEAKEEAEFSKYDDLLGSSDDEEEEGAEDEDPDEAFFRKLRSQRKMKETVNLDDISSGAESGAESPEDESSRSASPEPKKSSKEKKEKPAAKEAKPAKSARDTTFLPSLMGGYISGSESASDVDVAPPKKRLGQRQRQMIAEKKYGEKAKHVVNGTSRINGNGRDGGWDAKRGAVDSTDKRGGKPWKKGGREPLGGQGAYEQPEAPKPPKPVSRDDTGPLHPSWEARKKAKEALKVVEFSGSKVTFD